MRNIIGIITCIIGLCCSIYLCYLHGTMYNDNQGLIALSCFVGSCSAYFLILLFFKIRKEKVKGMTYVEKYAFDAAKAE